MTRRNQNNSKRKRLNRSFALNTNASSNVLLFLLRKVELIVFAVVNPTSRLESMANLMIEELRGTHRDDLKEELLKIYATKTASTTHLAFSSSKRNLETLLSNIHTFDDYVNARDEIQHGQPNHAEVFQDESSSEHVSKRETRRKNHSNFVPSMNEMTRTICTRSTKLNSSNDQNTPSE